MLSFGLFGSAVDESLDLVELVDSDDSAGVFSVAARFAPKARRPTGVTQRPGGKVENLIAVVAGQWNLLGTDQIEIIGFQAVDLIGMRTE